MLTTTSASVRGSNFPDFTNTNETNMTHRSTMEQVIWAIAAQEEVSYEEAETLVYPHLSTQAQDGELDELDEADYYYTQGW